MEKIDNPLDEQTLIALPPIQCRKLGPAGWMVISKLHGPEGIFLNESEELFCKTEGAKGEEWWRCGSCRFGVEDRILEIYQLYRSGMYVRISWYKHSVKE